MSYKSTEPINLLTAEQHKQINQLSRQKFDIQGRFEVVTFCRQKLGCELWELSIDGAKFVISELEKMKDFPRKPLPPRIDDVITPPPVRDESVWGPKL